MEITVMGWPFTVQHNSCSVYKSVVSCMYSTPSAHNYMYMDTVHMCMLLLESEECSKTRCTLCMYTCMYVQYMYKLYAYSLLMRATSSKQRCLGIAGSHNDFFHVHKYSHVGGLGLSLVLKGSMSVMPVMYLYILSTLVL